MGKELATVHSICWKWVGTPSSAMSIDTRPLQGWHHPWLSGRLEVCGPQVDPKHDLVT